MVASWKRHGDTYVSGKLHITVHKMVHTDRHELIDSSVQPTDIPRLIKKKGVAECSKYQNERLSRRYYNKAFSEAEVLIMVCTYSTKHDSDHARGHIHYDDIVKSAFVN